MVERGEDTRSAREWQVDVVVSHPEGTAVEEPTAETLMDAIVGWAEERGLHVGGGIRPCKSAFVKRRQIDAPPAGRELDALVAARVMGLGSTEDMPPYSTDPVAAFQVLELLRRSGRWCCIHLSSDFDYVWDVAMKLAEEHGNPEHGETLRVSSESLPEAICLAALLATQRTPEVGGQGSP